VTLSPGGLSVNAGPAQAKGLPWSEVVDARLVEFAGNKFVAIEVVDPKKLLLRQRSVSVIFALFNHWIYGTPVFVAERVITGDIYRLLSAIKTYGKRD